MEILASVVTCIDKAVENLAALGYLPDQIKGANIHCFESFNINLIQQQLESLIRGRVWLFGISIQANPCTLLSYGWMEGLRRQWIDLFSSLLARVKIASRFCVCGLREGFDQFC